MGENAAIIALRKQKIMGNTPEHPNTTYIKELVTAGNVDGIREAGANLDIQLPFFVMAASHLTGDSTRIGQLLRPQADKRGTLIDLLVQLAEENAGNGATAEQVEEQVEEQVKEPVAEEKPKKRRKRRTKAEMEAARAEAAKEKKEAQDAPAPAVGGVDFDRAFNDILSAIDDVRSQNAAGTGDTIARLSKASDKRYDDLALRIDRIGSALVALEGQLLATGMIFEPAVSKCFED